MHLLHEGVIAFLCIITIYIAWREIVINSRYTQDLQQANKDKKPIPNKVKFFKNELFTVLETQFKEWSLSKHELSAYFLEDLFSRNGTVQSLPNRMLLISSKN